MISDPTNVSPDIIQAYLSYLQEMSRKISLRSGMENVLYRKTKKNHHYYLPAHSVDSRYLKQVKDYTEKETDKQFFLGNGLVVGVLKKKGIRKYIASPLLFLLVNIDTDESGRNFTYEVEWDSVSLNYDLFTLVLEKDSDEENELETNKVFNQLVEPFNVEIFEIIEKDLESYLEHEQFIEKLQNISIAREIFEKIKSEVGEFQQTTILKDDFTLEKLNELMKNERLTFFSHLFFYVASLPGQLSTYTALRKLIQEVR